MNIHQHAPPGASGGLTALARLLEADWSRGVPAGYLEALDRLRRLRGEFEEQIAAAIDGLDILDMAITDLEVEEDANDEDLGGEPSLGAPEAVACGDGPATAVLKARRNRSNKLLDGKGKEASGALKPACGLARSVDRSCDQSDWPRDGGERPAGDDAEFDTADDEPSLGAPEQRLSITSCVNGYWFTHPTDQADWAAGGSDDREGNLADTADEREGGDVSDEPHDEDTDRENTAPERFGKGFQRCGADDAEPSLGSPEACLALGVRGGKGGFVGFATLDQTGWAVGTTDDREWQHEGCEPDDADYEDCGRNGPRVPVGIGFDGAVQQLVVGRVVEDGGLVVLGTAEVAYV